MSLHSVKGCGLYRLLRPELVKNLEFSLCSDAFSKFNVNFRTFFDLLTNVKVENIGEENAKVAKAVELLFQQLIPEFSVILQEWFERQSLNRLNITNDDFCYLVTEAHKKVCY